MSLRAPTLALLTLIGGCASAEMASDAPLDEAEVASVRTLTFESAGSKLELLPGATVDLAVRLRDALGQPVPGQTVDFALAGMSLGGSLTPARADTDAQGVARTKLRAGSMAGTLQVRAASEGADSTTVNVTVGAALPSEARVRVAYEGQRSLASYTITAIEGKTCDGALLERRSGEVVHRIEHVDESVDLDVAPGTRVAVVAWGSDETGAPLARGCEDISVPRTADQAARITNVSVALRDVPLELQGELNVELELSVAAPLKRLSETLDAAVDRALSPTGRYTLFSEAEYYLDAIATVLRTRGQLDALSRLEGARKDAALPASLAPALTNAGRGPSALAARVGSLLTERGSLLLVSATLRAAASGSVLAISANGDDTTASLSLAAMPAMSVRARFDESRAVLRLDELRLALGLGEYGRTLLSTLRASESTDFTRQLSEAAGCTQVFAPWVATQLAGMCDQACALAACDGAVQQLYGAMERALVEVDAAGSAISMVGSVPVHDRTDDGKVDDLGPVQLSGGWSPGGAVSGQLREPARNALTL
jgi:hypothetical protein